MKADRGERRHRSNLRFETLNAFTDRGIAEAGLTPAGIAVWLVLFRHAQLDGTTTHSAEGIARSTGLCKRTVLRALKELRAAKMLRTVKRGNLNKGASRYLIAPYPMEE